MEAQFNANNELIIDAAAATAGSEPKERVTTNQEGAAADNACRARSMPFTTFPRFFPFG